MSRTCPLCLSSGVEHLCEDGALVYHRCTCCDLRFLDPAHRLPGAEEKARYLLHQNDITDPRYRAFVTPLHDHVTARVPKGAVGLDFGSGTGPVLADMLQKSGYEVKLFDPIFHPDTKNLEQKYDFIVASEVVEHLFDPHAEFGRLKVLISDGGLLALMTSLYKPNIDFARWHYRRDPTHVAFYSRQALLWVRNNFKFKDIHFAEPNIVLLQA